MLSTLGVIDFLNPREKAWLVWLLVILAFAYYKGGRDTGSATWEVVRAAAHPKILLLFGAAAAYSAGVVYLATRLGLWHTSATKETVYWFFGTGVAVVGNATGMSSADPDFVRKLVGRAVRWTIVVEFLVTLYVFPLAVELLLTPVIILFVALQANAQYQATEAAVRKFIDGILFVIGLALLLYVAVQVLSDPGSFWTREHAEGFLAAPALTVALVPLLFLVAWYSRRELENVRRQFQADGRRVSRQLVSADTGVHYRSRIARCSSGTGSRESAVTATRREPSGRSSAARIRGRRRSTTGRRDR